jgi:hypothetical protein
MKATLNHSSARGAATGTRLPSSQLRGSAEGSNLRITSKSAGRRPVMLVVSVVTVVTCSTLFALIYLHSSRLVAVIGVTRLVPQGQTVQSIDLRQIDISLAAGVELIPVSSADQVIGRRAAVTLLAGTLLSPLDVGGSHLLPSNQAIVGIDLKPGMLPAEGVEAGESVAVVLTGPAGTAVSDENGSGSYASGVSSAGSTTTTTTTDSNGSIDQPDVSGSTSSADPVVISSATVVAVNTNPDDSGAGDVVVSVEVPATVAPLVADSSAAGQAALVQIGGST